MPRRKKIENEPDIKPVKKKAAPKKRIAQDAPAFNLLQSNVAEVSKELLIELSAKKGSYIRHASPISVQEDLRESMIPFPAFMLQYLTGNWGIRHRTIIDFVGEEGVGKSSLAYTLAGSFAQHNIPTVLIESEGKPVDDQRVLQCLNPDRKLARTIREHAITQYPARNLQDMYILLIRTIELYRRSGLPDNYPIFFVVDTFSKLMSNTESEVNGMYTVAKKKAGAEKKVAIKDLLVAGSENLLSGTNFEHAKFAQKLSRILPGLMDKFNVVVMFIRHANDRVDMAGGFRPMAAPSKSMNTTSLGGRAIPQSAALQMTAVKGQQIKKGSKVIGQNVNLTVVKNNYGPGRRQVSYLVNWEDEYRMDPVRQTPAITFDLSFCEFLVENKLLGCTKQSAWEFSCADMGLHSVSPTELSRAIHARPEAMQFLGRMYGISGYAPLEGEAEPEGVALPFVEDLPKELPAPPVPPVALVEPQPAEPPRQGDSSLYVD